MEATYSPLSTALPTLSSRSRWIGRVLSAVPVLFLAFDAALKLAHPSFIAEASSRIGFPDDLAGPLGVILLTCLVLYLVPRTALLGATLLTAYLGGAVAIHARIADPLFTHTLFPVYVAVLLWGGLLLRDPRVRVAIGPVRRPELR